MYTADIEYIALRDGTFIPMATDERSVYIDLNGCHLSNHILGLMVSAVNAEPSPAGCNIFIRRMGVEGGMPPVYVDSGEIYDLVVELLKEIRDDPRGQERTEGA